MPWTGNFDKNPKKGNSIWGDEVSWDDINDAASKDVDNFFGKRYKSSLGWSTSKLTDTTSTSHKWGGWSTGYSTIGRSLDDDAKVYELLKKAYQNTKDMITILDFPFNVYIQTSVEDPIPHNDKTGRKIFIPTKVIDDKTRDDDTKIVVICGLGIHEAAHLKYTSIKIMSRYLKNLESAIGKEEAELAFMLSNFIEDSRVENKLLEERPGYAAFLDRTNDWKFETISSKFSTRGVAEAVELKKLLENIVALICFPNKLDIDFMKKYESAFTRFKSIIYPLPGNTLGSCEQGFKLYKAIREEIEHFGLGKAATFNFTMKQLKASLDNAEQYFSTTATTGEDGDAELVGTNLCSRKSIKEKISKSLKKDGVVSDLLSGKMERGKDKKTLFRKMSGNKDRYINIKRRISKFVPVVKKAVKGIDKNYDFTIHGCRSGLLDTTKLVEAIQGVPQVYLRQGHVKTTKTTVCVLIDESGSMRGEKIALARQAAVLLNEALKDAGVDLYIYGHSADEVYGNDTYLRIYKEKDHVDQYSLSSIDSHIQNRDGNAIREVAKRVRKFTDSRCLFFVISDGQPAAGDYYGTPAMYDVRKAVGEVENDGFDVIQITIDGLSVEEVKTMGFKHIIDLKDSLDELPKLLAKHVKKAIMENKKTTTEM